MAKKPTRARVAAAPTEADTALFQRMHHLLVQHVEPLAEQVGVSVEDLETFLALVRPGHPRGGIAYHLYAQLKTASWEEIARKMGYPGEGRAVRHVARVYAEDRDMLWPLGQAAQGTSGPVGANPYDDLAAK